MSTGENPIRNSGRLVVGAVIFAAILFFVAMKYVSDIPPGSVASPTPKSPAPMTGLHAPGMHPCEIRMIKNPEMQCYVAVDQNSWKYLDRAFAENNVRGVLQLFADELSFFEVEIGTKAEATGGLVRPRQVRILTGEHAGRSGWIGDEYLQLK